MQGDVSKWEGYADWRNRAAVKGRHGGMLAASFVLGQSQISKFTHFPKLLKIFSIDTVGIT